MVSYTENFDKIRFYRGTCLKNFFLGRNGILNALYITIYVNFALVTPSKGDLDCGNLTIKYSCHENHVDAKLTLVPNDVIRISIQQGNPVTWYHWNERWIDISNNNNNQKYEEEELSIIIHNLSEVDAGIYTLGCIHAGKTYRSDTSLESKEETDLGCGMQTSTSILTSPTNGILLNSTQNTARFGDKPSSIFTSTVITVMAVCSVIIVLVLAGTVIFVQRKKGITHTALSRFASHEGGSTVNLHQDTEPRMSIKTRNSNIYNEIDSNICKDGKHVSSISKQSLLPLQNSPALPKRPSNAKPIKYDTEKDYDMITENTKFTKTNDPLPGTSSQGGFHDEDYATIRQQEDGWLEVHNTKAINNNSMPEYSKVLKRPVYAKVQKRKDAAVAGASKQNETTCIKDYTVVFPAIEYANVVTNLGNIDNTTLDESEKYCNLASRRRSERKASNKSLRYAVLDHTGCDAYLREQNCGPYDLPDFVKLVSCQYASIDFDKKAFVAPIRKAPSSWYKRNRKQKKKM